MIIAKNTNLRDFSVFVLYGTVNDSDNFYGLANLSEE